jgi:hypothetical protein
MELERRTMIEYRIEIAGIDVTNWIREKPNLSIQKGDLGDIVELPNLILVGDNTKHIFTPKHPNSIFTTAWIGDKIKIYRNEDIQYEGLIRNVSVTDAGRLAQIETTDLVNFKLGLQMALFTQNVKTLAELSQEIYTLYGINTDSVTYTRSKEIQEDWLLQARANVNVTQQNTLLQTQQWLTQAGIARHWFVNGTAYYQVYDPDETRYSMHTFTDDDIMDITEYDLIEKNEYDGYTVVCAGSVLAEKPGSNTIPVLNADSNSPFVFVTPETGHNWGERTIEISKKEQYSIKVVLTRSKYTEWLTMRSNFTIQSTRYGFTNTFQTLLLDYSSDLYVILGGVSE